MTVSAILGALGVSKALGLNDIADEAIDKACELIFDRKGKELLKEVQSRLRAYTGTVPLNHDLEHAIRLAELTASLVLLRRYRQLMEEESFDSRSLQLPYDFIKQMYAWLLDQIGLSTSMELKPNEDIVKEINSSLDVVLSATKADIIEQELSAARDQVWAIMQAGAGPAPSDFAMLFLGKKKDEPGWSILFVAFIREALKTNARVEVAFITNRLSGARELLQRVDATVRSIEENTRTIKDGVSELLALARQNAIIKRAAQEGISEPLLRSAASMKYFDSRTREIIRSKFLSYCQEHRVGLSTLASKIEECLEAESGISVKGLRRFMKGVRVDDSFVALLINFADTLPNASLPITRPTFGMKVEFAINERGEAIIFHSRPFNQDLDWFEFNTSTGRLTVVFGGDTFREFDFSIRPELARYLVHAHRVLVVQMDEKTNEPVDGCYKPILILKVERDEYLC